MSTIKDKAPYDAALADIDAALERAKRNLVSIEAVKATEAGHNHTKHVVDELLQIEGDRHAGEVEIYEDTVTYLTKLRQHIEAKSP